jgi:hypothetical protein
MNISKVRCCYCHQPRDFSADLHGCAQSLEAQAHVAGLIDSMKAMQERPGSRELSSNDMRLREDRRHEMATAIKVTGGGVRPEYN